MSSQNSLLLRKLEPVLGSPISATPAGYLAIALAQFEAIGIRLFMQWSELVRLSAIVCALYLIELVRKTLANAVFMAVLAAFMLVTALLVFAYSMLM